jgi:hypothetical protein
MALLRLVLALSLAGVSTVASSQALPVYTPPASPVGGAIGNSIVQNLVSRGFAANDPRVIRTVVAVGGRVAPLVEAAGAGATWLGVAGTLAPYAVAGVVVYAGYKWYFDKDGKVTLKPPGSMSDAPVFSAGVVPGKNVYYLNNSQNVYAGSLEEAFSYLVSNAQKSNGDAVFGVPSFKQIGSNIWSMDYTYKIPSIGINNGSYSGYGYLQVYNGTYSCAPGSAATSSGCVSVQLDKSPYAGAPLVGKGLYDAYTELPLAAKEAPLSPDLAAELANRHWRDASKLPDYDGVPWSSPQPVTPDDAGRGRDEHPTDWPKTKDLDTPVPGPSPTAPSPIAPTSTNPNQTSAPAGSQKVDLGPDPGIGAPTLADPPTEIFKPVVELLKPFTTWTVPSHSSVCPTWSAAPSIAGHVFDIQLDSHCAIAEQYRSVITAAALACWVVIALFIVLSA